MGRQSEFYAFKGEVDKFTIQKAGIPIDYLDIEALREYYDENLSAEEAAKRLLIKDGFPESEWNK